MEHFGALEGMGMIKTAGEPVGPTHYRMEIVRGVAVAAASGELRSTLAVLKRIADAGSGELELPNGIALPIRVVEADPEGGHAIVSVDVRRLDLKALAAA